MGKGLRITLIVLAVLLVIVLAGLAMVTRSKGIEMVTHPMEERTPLEETPADYGLAYEDVTVTTADNLKLVGWYVPSENGAVVMVQHGFRSDRDEHLKEAEFLHRNGYGVLLTCFRTHDRLLGRG